MAHYQQNMLPNDELAAMFSRNLTLNPQPIEQPKQPEPEAQPITYSITQHYHHSSHLVREANETTSEPQRRSSEPAQTQQPSAEMILNQNGIDHSALLPFQMELFKTAEDPQKLRLIELWRICPPTNRQENPAKALTSTTVEQEEFLAHMRQYQRQCEENEQRQYTHMSLDGTPLTPVQTEDGRWTTAADAEPYMESGYELLARREYEESMKQQHDEAMFVPKNVYFPFGTAVGGRNYCPATDPAYAHDWSSRQQAMEDQYGRFQMEM